MTTKQTVYVAGWPRSGTTWLTRLLGDVLNCPTGGALPKLDTKEIATEGQNRPGPYIVRKGHFRLVNEPGKPFILTSHKMNWQAKQDELVVFIVRDPRDAAASGAFYWERSIDAQLDKMENWSEFVKLWLTLPATDFSLVRYEVLHRYTVFTVGCILRHLGLPIGNVTQAVHRQSFDQRKVYTVENLATLPHGRNHLKFLRKGVVGDWRNHFTPEQEQRAWEMFGRIMTRLGYER